MIRLSVATCLAACLWAAAASAGQFRVAVIPPPDFQPTISAVQAVCKLAGAEVRMLSPEELVQPGLLRAPNFQAAVYAGAERYLYKVLKPGDAAQALLDYLSSGGTLIVAGSCWPFYRPVEWTGGDYVAYNGPVVKWRGPEDSWLRAQMQAFKQRAAGTFNRFLGLNISGEGTRQFERPPEEIKLVRTPEGARLFPSLPAEMPFPATGDLRFRPASPNNLGPGVRFTPVMVAVGKSGTEYGPAIAVVEHVSGRLKGGAVVYIWGTLVHALGWQPIADALAIAARRAGSQSGRIAERAAALAQRCRALAEAAGKLELVPEGIYFARQAEEVRRNAELLVRIAWFGDTERMASRLARLEQRVRHLEQWFKQAAGR